MITSLNLTSHTALYHAFNEDKVSINGTVYQSRINRIISLDVEMINSLKRKVNLEMFCRTQDAGYLSQTEIDFWNDLAYAYDQVQFTVDDTGKCISLNNYNDIIQKQQSTIDNVKQSFKGIEVDSIIKQITQAGRENIALAKHLIQYRMYGLFFMGLYGQVYNHSRKKRHQFVFGSKGFLVNECFTHSQKTNEQNDELLTYNISGEICEINLEEWKLEAKRIGVKNISESQEPVLNYYRGSNCMNIKNSMMEEAEINLSFSYGKNYKREQYFSLILMNDQELIEII